MIAWNHSLCVRVYVCERECVSNRDRKGERGQKKKEGWGDGLSQPPSRKWRCKRRNSDNETVTVKRLQKMQRLARQSVWKIQNLTTSRWRTGRDLARVESCPVQLTGRDSLGLSTTLSLPTPFLVLSAFRSPSSSSIHDGFTGRGNFRHWRPNLLSYGVQIRWKSSKRVALVLITLRWSHVTK